MLAVLTTASTRAAGSARLVKDSGMTDRSYTLLSMGPTMVGGLMSIPEDAARFVDGEIETVNRDI